MKFSDVAVHSVGRSLSMQNKMKASSASASYAGLSEKGNSAVAPEAEGTSFRPLCSIRSPRLPIAVSVAARIIAVWRPSIEKTGTDEILRFGHFHDVFQRIFVLAGLWISCTATRKSTHLRVFSVAADKVRIRWIFRTRVDQWPGLEIAVIGLEFFAPKVVFSWPYVDRFGKKFWGLMILGQVKSIQHFC